MRIEIRVGRSTFRRWHSHLVRRLRLSPGRPDVRVALVDGAGSLPGQVEALLQLERLVLRRARETLFDKLPPPGADDRLPSDFVPDLVIDCSGAEPERSHGDGCRRLRPLFDGLASEPALVAALLSGTIPDIAIEDRDTGRIALSGRPGGGASGLIGGLEVVLSRTILLVERAVAQDGSAEADLPAVAVRNGQLAREHRSALTFALRNLASDCARAIFHLCFRAPHWRLGWRLHDGPGVMERGDLGGPRWTILGDRARSFLADPFPVVWGGRTVLFFEEFEYRVGRGTISAIEFDAEGPVGEPFPVLQEPWHQSYPFIMEHQGALYMIPETSLAGQVMLYRCTGFPTQWERVGILLEGIEASDCTVFQHDGFFWMMSSTREGLGGYSDTLSIHYARTLFGPWSEHAERPVLIDAGLARPAGHVVNRDGRLWRPIQDCRRGYGQGLALTEIDRLDPQHFSQTLRANIIPGPHWPGRRLHTLNRAGRLEVIDGATTRRRLPLGPLLPNLWATPDPE